ncbi:MAG: pyrroline-5-carboxylate reductase [Candidatus Hadarchaeum sp.]|uniref:pyrroline-5-carboxylate reductase n=1 Tax=Candidatus Hadarchaeum sp. TaxID=2883567 RepID=UPI003D0E6816
MRVGVIGGGNLGSSLIKGFLRSGVLQPDEIVVSEPDEGKARELARLSIGVTSDNRELVRECDVVFIAVKPDLVEPVLKEVEDLSAGKLFVSVAAGVSTAFIEARTRARVIRAMPNLCGAVLQMASAYSKGSRATAEDEKTVAQLLGKLGTTFPVEEDLLGAVTAVSGSGPAFFFYLMKAVQDAGVELGLPKDISFKLAAQTARGASEIVLNSEEKIEELIRRVCTPRGTTIEGMKVLEERKVADAIKEAVKAAARRAEEISR